MNRIRRFLVLAAAGLAVAAPAAAQVPSVPPPYVPPVEVPAFPEITPPPAAPPAPSRPSPSRPTPPPSPTPAPQPPPSPSPSPSTPSPGQGAFAWASGAARTLERAGIWPGVSRSNLSQPATKADLAKVLVGVAEDARGIAPSGDPVAQAVAAGWMTAGGTTVTVAEANRGFVLMLGLQDERRALTNLSTADGQRLRVPRGFADSVLTREAGLHHNLPASEDGLELGMTEAIRRADLAGMGAGALDVGGWRRDRLAVFTGIQLPALTASQKAVIESALAYVGQPYVWGGDWTTPASPWGAQAHGGFDCSGLVWMTLKASRGTQELSAGRRIGGRTADDMAWEAPRAKVNRARIAPADLLFFGDAGPRTRRGGIGHVGIALGNGWMIHSSGSRAGVSISHLPGYWSDGLAWGRRVV